MSERKDKKKVVGEPMTDEQIKVFLGGIPEAGEDPHFHDMLKAYRSLREEDFQRFLTYFVAANGNVNAKGPNGQTMLETVSDHTLSSGYADALRAAGAK